MKKILKKIILISLCVILLLYIVGSFFGVMFVFNSSFGRCDTPEYTLNLSYDDVKKKYPREELTFLSGNNLLAGYIYGKGKKGLVVISHGMGGYADDYLGQIMYFADHDYTVFAFDNTGSGNSEGDGTMGMAQSAIDLDAALGYIEKNDRFKNLPLLVFGHSWGGYAAAAVLAKKHDVAASISVAGYDTPMGIVSDFAKSSMPKAAVYAEYPFMWLHNKIRFGKNANVSAVDAINSTDTPILIVHGKKDQVIGYDTISIIARKDDITNPNAQFKTYSGKYSGHNSVMLDEEAAGYVEKLEKEYKKLSKKYKGKIPDEQKKEFFDKADKKLANTVSTEFMDDMNEFYIKVLKKGEKSNEK